MIQICLVMQPRVLTTRPLNILTMQRFLKKRGAIYYLLTGILTMITYQLSEQRVYSIEIRASRKTIQESYDILWRTMFLEKAMI